MARHHVLLIDDDKWLVELFATTLKKHGFGVSVAQDGLEGMQRIDEKKPDVIVLDLFMPGPNGLVLLHELQSHADLASVPVVLCTNSADSIAKAELVPYGVRRVLDKTTMSPDDVVAAVRAYI